jgi:short subunit fatty acids transporter
MVACVCSAATNRIQPFFATPIPAVTRMRFGGVVGYTFLMTSAYFAGTAVALARVPARL